MLEIILVWLYAAFTTYIPGYFLLNGLLSLKNMYSVKGKTARPYRIRYRESYLIAGLILVSVYAQFVSLFMQVSLAANLSLLAVCAVLLVCGRKELSEDIHAWFINAEKSGSLPIYLIVFLVMAYGTSHGYQHYDTGYYHAQAIRWIETYGSVYGLGNLHTCLAYNSAAFPLSAFYSFSFLGTSVHPMAGYCALLLAFECVDLKKAATRGYPILADMVRCAALYYLFGCYNEMVSPASDTFVLSLTFCVVIRWLDLKALRERSFVPHALLAVSTFYLVSLKLTIAPLSLLTLHPLTRLIRKRKIRSIKPILICAGLSLLILLPYFLRNIKLSGYLVYPSVFLDIFNFDWKIPLDVLKLDAAEIKSWGRGGRDASLAFAPLSEWFPDWFTSLTRVQKILFVSDMAALPVFLCVSTGYLIFLLILKIRRDVLPGGEIKKRIIRFPVRRIVNLSDFLFLLAILYAQLLFWFFSAPLPRYGSVFLWLPFTVMAGRLLLFVFEKAGNALPLSAGVLFIVLVLAYTGYRSVDLIRKDIPSFRAVYLEKQQPYESFEVLQTKIDGVTFYYPAEGDQSGYYAFPATPEYNIGSFRLRGESLRQGFKPTG